MDLSFIIWNGSPEIFSFGKIALRWYGLLFALGFLVSQQILYYMYKKEGKPEKEVDTLTIVMVIATILGARLGHVIFYQPEIIWEEPLSVLLPIEFSAPFSFENFGTWIKSFRFTGFLGLASHGGAIGILLALWLYARKKKLSYLNVLDRIVILVAITGAFIRLGNFFNSEIIGKPTDSAIGVVFANRLTDIITNEDLPNNPVETMGVIRNSEAADTLTTTGQVPMLLYFFMKSDVSENDSKAFLEYKVKNYISNQDEHFYINLLQPLQYFFAKQDNGSIAVKVPVVGIARHPAQLYESISCVFLFAWLFWIWKKYNGSPPEGRIFGLFLIVLWGLRFSYEFLKENQVSFESSLPINMGQILSIPLFVAGIFILIRSYKKGAVVGQGDK
jgi:phosphatidylglycerol---prolipoprotein diacylglyceryl transferase